MKQNLRRSTLLAASVLAFGHGVYAQMDPTMPMGQSEDHSGKPAGDSGKRPTAMPFGRVADGSQPAPSNLPLPPTQTPLRLGTAVQEQEHPDHRTGSLQVVMPDLLADVKTRPAQPVSFFQDAALKRNPTLREAEAQVRRLHAIARQQGLWSNPEVGYEADHVRGGSYNGGEQGGYVQQSIPISGQRSTARNAAEQQAHAAETALQLQRMQVQAGVQLAFYAALAAQSEVALRLHLMQIASDAAETAHQLANVGQADAPDILQSEVEREQAKLDYATAQRTYRKRFAQLAAMSGDVSIPVIPLQGDLAALPQLGSEAAQAAANGSPTLQLAEQQVLAEQAQVKSAHRQAMPELTVRAGLQQDNEPLTTTGRVGLVGVAQAGITLPLWNRNQGSVEAARAGVDIAQAEVQRRRLQLRAQAEQAMQDFATGKQQAELYRDELLPRAQRAYQLYQQKYGTMAAAYPQVLVSQRTYFQLQIDYVRALSAAWQSAVLLQNGLLSEGLNGPQTLQHASSSTSE